MLLLRLRQLTRCGDQTPTSVPPPTKGRSSLTNSPIFPLVPLYYWVLHGSIYSFLLVRYSCPFSAGVLHALLFLKVYSWCIRGERCTPHTPIPTPSGLGSLSLSFKFFCYDQENIANTKLKHFFFSHTFFFLRVL